MAREAGTAPDGQLTWFVAWMAVGLAYAVGILAVLSVGLVLLVLAATATVLLSSRGRGHVAPPGILAGVGVGLLYVAFLNRAGPGLVCSTTATGGSQCVERWTPWPWLAIGLALLVAGGFWFRVMRRRREGG